MRTHDAIVDYIVGQETAVDVQVRGHAGVWIADRLVTSPLDSARPGQANPHASSWLRWDENGIVYTLISDGLTQAEMLQLAEGPK